MKKRLCALVLVLALALGMVPGGLMGTAEAAEPELDSGYCGEEGDGTNLTWTLTGDGTLTISGEGEMGDYDDETPAPWNDYRSDIKRLVVEEGVTSVGPYAFYQYTALAEAAFPASLYSIGTSAFGGCTSLAEVSFSAECGIINGPVAFAGCTSLTEIVVPYGLSIGAFSCCTGLTSVTLLDSVGALDDSVFLGCDNLTAIYFEGDVPDYMSDVAFNNITATVYYPADNDTWTDEVMQDYGGNITWEAYGPVNDPDEPEEDPDEPDGAALMVKWLRSDGDSWYEDTNLSQAQWLTMAPNNNHYVRFYYGTADDYAALPLDGVLTTSDSSIISVGVSDRESADGRDYFIIQGEDFGTATVTYTVDGKSYPVELTVSLPSWQALYSEHERSEDTFVFEPEYDPVNGTVLYVMRNYGFYGTELNNLTLTVNGNEMDGASAEFVPRGDGTYDIKLTFAPGLPVGDRFQFYVSGDGHGHGHALKVKEEPRLLSGGVYWDEDGELQDHTDEDGNLILETVEGSYFPGYGIGQLKLYYGTTDDYEELSLDGTLTSSDPDVVSVEAPTASRPYYVVKVNEFGTATLTYTDGSTQYTATVSGLLGDTPVYYYRQERTEAAYVGPDTSAYDPETGLTLWVMVKGGIAPELLDGAYCELENVDGDWVTVTPVKRADGNYDLKVTVAPGLDIPERGGYSLYSRIPNWGGCNTWLRKADQESLRVTWLLHDKDLGWYEDTENDPSPADWLTMTPHNNHYVRFYFGTSGEYEALPLDGVITTSDSSIISVGVSSEGSADGRDYFIIQGERFGTATVTYTVQGVSYSVTLTVGLPSWQALYSEHERSEDTFVSDPQYDPEQGTVLYVMRDRGFSGTELNNLSVTMDGRVTDGLTAEFVARGDGTFDIKLTFAPGLPVNGDWLQLYVSADGHAFGTGIPVKAQPSLLFNPLVFDKNENLIPSVGKDGKPVLEYVSSYGPPPVGTTWLELYYGTPGSYQKLPTGGTFTSSNESVVRALNPSDQRPAYGLMAVGFGTATVTYTVGGQSYTAQVTIRLPVIPTFYSSSIRSEDTYLREVTYDPAEDLVLWLIGREGWDYVTATEVARDIKVDLLDLLGLPEGIAVTCVQNLDGRYDVRITLPAGLDISGEYFFGPQVDDVWAVGIFIRVKQQACGYTVEYYQESADGMYEVVERQWFDAKEGDEVAIDGRQYDFFTENTNLGLRSGTVTADGKLTLSRYYDRDRFTITFETNGGSVLPAMTAAHGTAITEPVPSLHGYEFAGWFLDGNLTERFTFDTMPTEDVTLYAKWDAVGGDRGIEYQINAITLKNEGYQTLTDIPDDGFYAEVSVTNLSATTTDTLVLAAYDEDGRMVGLWFLYANPQIGQTFVLGVHIENGDGRIATLKAFMLPMLGGVQPLANSVKVGK